MLDVLVKSITKSIVSSTPSAAGAVVNIISFTDVASGKTFYVYSTVDTKRRMLAASAGIQVNYAVLLATASDSLLKAIKELVSNPPDSFLNDVVKNAILAAGPLTPLGQALAAAKAVVGTFPVAAAPPADAKSDNTGAIVGGVIGGIIGLTLIVAAYMYFSKRSRAGPSVVPSEGSDVTKAAEAATEAAA